MPCGNVGVCANKSAPCRIVVSALEIVQPTLCIVEIASIAEGVVVVEDIVCYRAYGSGSTIGNRAVTPRIVSVCTNNRTCRITDTNDITLQILLVEVPLTALYF